MTERPQPPDGPQASATGALELVLQRFPERVEQIELCYAQLAAFREICEDYLEVNQALGPGEVGGPTGLPPGATELAVLLAELEAELIRALEGRSAMRSPEAAPAGCDD